MTLDRAWLCGEPALPEGDATLPEGDGISPPGAPELLLPGGISYAPPAGFEERDIGPEARLHFRDHRIVAVLLSEQPPGLMALRHPGLELLAMCGLRLDGGEVALFLGRWETESGPMLEIQAEWVQPVRIVPDGRPRHLRVEIHARTGPELEELRRVIWSVRREAAASERS